MPTNRFDRKSTNLEGFAPKNSPSPWCLCEYLARSNTFYGMRSYFGWTLDGNALKKKSECHLGQSQSQKINLITILNIQAGPFQNPIYFWTQNKPPVLCCTNQMAEQKERHYGFYACG